MLPAFLLNLTKDLSDWTLRLFYFWLVEGPKRFWKFALSISANFESQWATLLTLKNIYKPLYQDYSIAGRIMGPFFRLGRFLFGLVLHLLLFIIYGIAFVIFCLIFWGAPFFFIFNLFIWGQ